MCDPAPRLAGCDIVGITAEVIYDDLSALGVLAGESNGAGGSAGAAGNSTSWVGGRNKEDRTAGSRAAFVVKSASPSLMGKAFRRGKACISLPISNLDPYILG